MPNMSYCRFENTVNDMKDCLYAIEYDETDDLSSYELIALKDFLEISEAIVNLKPTIEDIIEKYNNE